MRLRILPIINNGYKLKIRQGEIDRGNGMINEICDYYVAIECEYLTAYTICIICIMCICI